jgi:hypothetical protein
MIMYANPSKVVTRVCLCRLKILVALRDASHEHPALPALEFLDCPPIKIFISRTGLSLLLSRA